MVIEMKTETNVVDPFELHPDTPHPEKDRKLQPIVLGQLDCIVQDLIERMHGAPNKLWGQTKGDTEYWLSMVVHEAEKISAS